MLNQLRSPLMTDNTHLLMPPHTLARHAEAIKVVNTKLRFMKISLDDLSEELSKAREEALFLKRDMDILWAEIKKKPLIIRLFYWWI